MSRVWIRIAAVFLLFVGWGCKQDVVDSQRIPDTLLTGVLVNVYAATAKAKIDGSDPVLARIEALEAFGLDTVALNNTIAYFAQNPDSASVAYQHALDSLITIQRDLHQPKEIDSLLSRTAD